MEKNKFGDDANPIHWAAMNGYSDVIKVLTNSIPVSNAPDSRGWTPIFMAAYFGHAEIIEILAPLLLTEDLLNSKNNFGLCPIYIAAKKGHVNVINTFLNLPGINQLLSRKNPIFRAVEKGHVNIVKLLAPLMEQPNSPNSNGDTPIDVAVRNYDNVRDEIIKLLLPFVKNNQ